MPRGPEVKDSKSSSIFSTYVAVNKFGLFRSQKRSLIPCRFKLEVNASTVARLRAKVNLYETVAKKISRRFFPK